MEQSAERGMEQVMERGMERGMERYGVSLTHFCQNQQIWSWHAAMSRMRASRIKPPPYRNQCDAFLRE